MTWSGWAKSGRATCTWWELQVPDESGLSNYYWVDLTAAGDDVLELARNLGGLEGGGDGNGGRHERMDLKVCRSVAVYAYNSSTAVLVLVLFLLLL